DALRKYRSRWRMTFVDSSEAALRVMTQQRFDVIVSDMRMPQPDGASLLTRVKAQYPGMTRIVLSGHADKASIVRTLPVAHQFLAKPCDPEQVGLVIERAFALNQLLNDERLRGLTGGLDKLPSLPQCYRALTEAMEREDVRVDEIAAIVERDPAMSLKVLQLVNSAYFGLARRVTSLKEAVVYLGVELLRSLALGSQVFSSLDADALAACGLDRLQERSLLTATLARRFLRDTPLRDEAFTAGLVHDIGRLVIAVCLRARCEQVVAIVRASGRTFAAVERELLGVSHAEIGAYLLGVWGLPASIAEAVACHHHPSGVPHDALDLAGAVHVAAAIASERLERVGSLAADDAIDADFRA